MPSRSRDLRPAKSPGRADHPGPVKAISPQVLDKSPETGHNEHLRSEAEARAGIGREWDCANLKLLESGLSRALAQLGENSRKAAVTVLETFLMFVDTVPEWERRNLYVPIWTFLAAQ